MFVRKIKSNKGVIEVGKFGVSRIDIAGDEATVYTAGGNVFSVRCKEIVDNGKVVANSRNHHKNLY